MALNEPSKRKMRASSKGNKKLVVDVLNWIRSPKSPRSSSSPNSSPSSSPQSSPRTALDSLVPECSPRSPRARVSISVPSTPTFSLPQDFHLNGVGFLSSNASPHSIKKCVSMDELESIKLIGVGSSSKVYLVRSISEIDPEEVPFTALKVISKDECAPTPEDKILEQLDHPLIVQPLSYFEDATNRYIHMPYVAGGELFYHLRKHKTFSEKIAQFYAAEIVLALEHVHSKNICYRDLKPENILLSKEGHIQLIDFGTAQFVKDVKNLHLAVGTLEYLAPEVIKMKKHEKQADWWALGVILYEMLTGKLPFTSPLNSEIPALVLAGKFNLPDHLSEPARSLIKGLLTKKTSKRLGCGKKGADAIKNHPFFHGVVWDSLLSSQPPISIQLDNAADTRYFDSST